ncbi:sensor histidine kinase [Sporofaciens musculi]|uniref:sensor histidine kinase n=1 Tax=Sporofaciens musculi TaxID=2681861 RepID=UPI00257065EA|nr:HAMP domain-containing sensor histidine kinase [Sporofaciens musculi]
MLGVCGIFQAQDIRRILVDRELAAASYLLAADVSPEVVAAAWNHREVTEEGVELLNKIGHTKQTYSYLLLLTEQTSLPLILILLCVGLVFAAVILIGAARFFRHREQVYEDAGKVIARYAQNQFAMHLPAGETGTIYQLFGSIEQLAQSLQAKSEMEYKAKIFLRDMISNISHQIKTPIAALSMYMEIIMEESGNEDVVKEFSRKSAQSLERIEHLVQSLLKMARLNTGNIVFEKQKCFASEIVEQAVYDLLERARREGKRILMEGEPQEALFCDSEWTKEAVGNLVKNALDHTEEGGVIRISWKQSPAVFHFNVEDNGCGIASEDIHHIFKQFYRSRTSSDRQGAGLGLSLAKGIVEGQGGSISVESRPGEGSIFKINFLI